MCLLEQLSISLLVTLACCHVRVYAFHRVTSTYCAIALQAGTVHKLMDRSKLEIAVSHWLSKDLGMYATYKIC